MIDLIIIVAYILVAVKILLKIFDWFENRFNIYQKPLTHHQQTSSSDISQPELQTIKQLSVSKITQNQQSIVVKPLVKQSSLKTQQIEHTKTESQQNNIQKSEVHLQESQNKNILPTSANITQAIVEPQIQAQVIIDSKPEQVVHQQIEEIKTYATQQIKTQNQSESNQALRSQNFSLRQQCDKLLRQQVNLNKKIEKISNQRISSEEAAKKVIQLLRTEKLVLENKLQSIQLSYEQTIKDLQNKINQQAKQLDNLLQQEVANLKKQNNESNENKNLKSQHRIQETVNQTISSQIAGDQTTIVSESGNQAKIEQLRSELQFCQSQLQQAYQSESKLKEQIQQLKVASNNSRLKSRGQISISDVINHPEYLRIKDKLQKYQTGTSSSHVRSIVRAQFTPQGERLSKGLDSRISERRSFISSKYGTEGTLQKNQNSEQVVFGQCNFMTPQTKHFLLDEIRKIKKLPIKKTKLIYKLDKLTPTNPHQFIDNIPNIVLLIELTNKKILAAFTQTAFSKEDVIHAQKTTSTIARSRLGSNKSLIIDLTNKASFLNNNPNETIIYDENAIVWGKDQILIKNDEPTLLYSSFGSQQGVYWDGKHTLQDLLGGNQGFERINQYEFYRIYIG